MLTVATQSVSHRDWLFVCAIGLAGYGAVRLAQALFLCPPGMPTPPIPASEKDGYVVGLVKRTFFRHFYVVRQGESLMCLKGWCDAHENRPFVMKIFLHSHIVLSDPLDAEQILVRQEPVCPKGFGYDLVRSVIGEGLLAVCDRKKHQRHRRLLAPLFASENIKLISNSVTRRYSIQLLGTLLGHCQQTSSGGDNENNNNNDDGPATVNLTNVINAMALSAIGEGAFSATPAESVQVRAHFDTMMKFTKMNYFCPYLRNQSQQAARSAVAGITDALLSKHICDESLGEASCTASAGAATVPRHRTVLAALMDNLDDAFTPSDVVDHLVTFLFAGHDTTSHTLQMLLVLLAAHPRVQEKLHAILEAEVMPQSGRFPMIEELLGCDYLCAVVDEVLRLYPAAPLIYRDTTEDVHLPSSDVVVPANSTVVISIFSIHRNKNVYGTDADAFRPERWLGTAGTALRARCGGCGFMPFSRGRRNCIGQEFGYQEALLVTAFLVRHLAFFPAGDFPVTRFLITMSTKDPVVVRLAPREGVDVDAMLEIIHGCPVPTADDDDGAVQPAKVVLSGSEHDYSESGGGADTGEVRTPSNSSLLTPQDTAHHAESPLLTPGFLINVN